MQVFYLKFSTSQAQKVGALLSQYESYRLLMSWSKEEGFFSTPILLTAQASKEDIELMQATDLKQFFTTP